MKLQDYEGTTIYEVEVQEKKLYVHLSSIVNYVVPVEQFAQGDETPTIEDIKTLIRQDPCAVSDIVKDYARYGSIEADEISERNY